MSQLTADRTLTEENEQFRVLHWRLAELLRGGFDLDSATEVAFRLDVDLHEALNLLEYGCPPSTALRILL